MGEQHARAFGEALCRRLGVDAGFLVPGFEDVFYYLWREHQLPCNVDPFDSRLEDEQERTRLRRIFQQGLRTMVGLALPLTPVYSGADGFRWTSGRWFLRDERMYLHPGDSPDGLSPAARLAAVGGGGRSAGHLRARSVAGARRASGAR